jgi:hypothetical protein
MKLPRLRFAPLLALVGATTACLATGANANIFYSNNFEQGAQYPEWSSNQLYTTNPSFTRFLGRYSNNAVALTLQAPPVPRDRPREPGDDGDGGNDGGGAPPGPRQYVLDFSFYCIDSWDGINTDYGPDHFAIRVNNALVFDESFANQHEWQSYDGTPIVGPTQLGFDGRWNDSIYTLSIPFATDSPTIRIDFYAYGLQSALTDESWGIDNVNISTVPVPAPAAASALLGFGALALRRRR